MPDKKLAKDKAEALKACGAFNARHRKVKDPLFGDFDFFDPADIVQVKYEMLRQVRVEGQSVSGACEAFGFSRVSFYQIRQAYEDEGLYGLNPKKHGPRRAHKLSEEIMDAIRQAMARDRSLRAQDLAGMVAERFSISVHPRSIERALARNKKKRQRRTR